MKRAFIFANGNMERPPAILQSLHDDDLIIAADGGTQHCRSLGLMPGIIIGDLDSLAQDNILYFQQAGTQVIQFPPHKDETDLELALQLATARQAHDVYILGGLGARWDMTIANILLLAHPNFSNLNIRLVDGVQEIFLLRGEQQVVLHSQAGSPISLIPLAGEAKRITTRGLEYALEDESLVFGSPRGISNVFLNDQCTIRIREGLLLCIYNPVE